MRTIVILLIAISYTASVEARQLASESDRREALRDYRDGQELLSAERWDKAAAAFRKAIDRDRLFTDAYYGLGQAYIGLKQYASAVQAYEGCLQAARSMYGLREKNRVGADRQLDDTIREMRDTVRRLRSQPGGQSSVRATQAELRLQELERSRTSLQSVFEPPATVLLALGSAHFRIGNVAQAEGSWLDAVRINKNLGEAWNNLAVVYLQSGRKRQALDAVTNAERAGFRVNPRLKEDIAALKDSLTSQASPTTGRSQRVLQALSICALCSFPLKST